MGECCIFLRHLEDMAWISRYSACKSVGLDHENVGRSARIFFAAGIFYLLSFRSEAQLLLAFLSKMVPKWTPGWPDMVHFTPFGYPWASGVASGRILVDFDRFWTSVGTSWETLLGAFGHPGAIFGPSDIKKERFFDTPILDQLRTPFWTSQECENGALVYTRASFSIF